MTGEKISAEFACGQILFSLKNSRLHYNVKETPYSAYITIRKEIIKSFKIKAFEPLQVKETSDINENLKNVEKENSWLRERNFDVEREHALLKIELEQMEIKFRELKETNEDIEDKYEDIIQENSKIVKKE